MKKLLLCISILACVLSSCGGDSDTEAVVINPAACSAPVSDFTVQQNADRLTFNITSQPGALYYEAALCPTGMCSGPGTIFPLDVETNSISLTGFPLTGDLVVYVRSVCQDNNPSAWSGPKVVVVDEYCGVPQNLKFIGNSFYWDYDMFMPQTSNYQVQYGPEGFNLGSGTTVTVNGTSYHEASMSAGQSYDFYVRAFCVNGLGYGNWAGPYTYFSEENQNMCLAPINVLYTIQNTSSPNYKSVTFTWNGNGEDTFECSLVKNDQAPEEGDIFTTQNSSGIVYYSLEALIEYDFYIRTVCSNGNRTAWLKKDVNLN